MSENMYEVRCYGCHDLAPDVKTRCYVSYLLKEEECHNIASKPCFFCSGNAWEIGETSLTVKEYFARMLKDPTGTIGYHVTQRDVALEVQAPLD